MKPAICACLFMIACKGESKPAQPAAAQATATEAPSSARPARPPPSLPDPPEAGGETDRPRPQLPEGERPDLSDPAVREEMRAMREERRKHREAQLDTNKDGVVSPEERQQRMVPMLKRLDSDGDGKVTPDELASSDRRMGFDDPAAVDSDGNGEISLAELDAAVTARREQMRARWRGRGGRGAAGSVPD